MAKLPKLLRLWTWAPLVLIVLISMPLPTGSPAHASIIEVTDYCYRTKVQIANGTGAELPANSALALEIYADQLRAQGFLDPYVWDLRPVTTALAVIEVTAQDLDEDPARWWVRFPTAISDAGTVSFWIYTGCALAKRDQGFIFAGSDTVTVGDHADLDFTNDFEIIATVQTPDNTQGAWFATKFATATSEGYRFGMAQPGGVGKLRAQVEDQVLDVNWDGTGKRVRMQFDAPNLYLHEWDSTAETWDELGTLDTGLGAVTANDEDLVLGSSFTGVIRGLELRDNVGTGSYAKVAHWGFHPANISETSAVNPTYTGAVQNEINPGTHDGTYNLSRDQTDITTSVGAVATSFAEQPLTVTEQFKDFLGDATETDIFSKQTTAERLPFYSMLSSAQEATGMPENAFWIMVVSFSGGAIAVPVYAVTKRFELAAGAMGVAFVTGGLVGLFAPWVAAIFGFGALGVGLLARWGGRGG